MTSVFGRPTHAPMITFLYSERCPRCGPALRAVWRWCDAVGVRLFVRRPTVSELSVRGFAFPATLVPAGAFNNPQAAFLIGDRPVEALEQLHRARVLR